MSRSRTPVAILGATGVVGQRLIQMLDAHPWFEIAELVASGRSTGKRYDDATKWLLHGTAPSAIREMTLAAPGTPVTSRIMFSALAKDVAVELEPHYASAGHAVVSNASAFRDDPRVPLVIPDINAEDISLVTAQPWWSAGGCIVTNPNCSVVGLAMALAPLHREFGIESVVVTTLQALSGGGTGTLQDPQFRENVVPHIPGEADKIASEPLRILGADFPISVSVNRVPVVDGHTQSVFVRLKKRVDCAEVTKALQAFRARADVAVLPSCPAQPLAIDDREERPQPRLDVDRGDGMVVTVGPVTADAVFDARFTLLVHNTIRGAAGAAILNAELLVAQKLVD